MIYDRLGQVIRRGSVVVSPTCSEPVLLCVWRFFQRDVYFFEFQLMTLEHPGDFPGVAGASTLPGSCGLMMECPSEARLNCEVLYDLR